MHNTLSSEQANQLDTTEKIQTGFESAEFSDSENQEIHDEYFVHKNTEIWIPGHDKNIYKAKVIGHENNRPRVHYVNWNRKYDTTFDSYSVWIYLQLVEKLKQHTVMTDEVNNLIQNAFETPAQFSFESSSSGLTQDLARLDLGDNNRADKILSNAEKESLMKEIFPLKNTNYSVPHENEVLWEDIWNTVCTHRCKFYRLPTGKIGKQYVEMLNCELELFLKSNIPSERLLVFSALILHRDKVRHSKDVKITIESRMKEWSMEKFQPLVQSFKRCIQFSSKAVRTQKSDPEEKLRAFAKMVQEGNIKNATRFLADENGDECS